MQVDRESLLTWARSRFESDIPEEDFSVPTVNELTDKLTTYSETHYETGLTKTAEAVEKVKSFFNSAAPNTPARYIAGNNGALDSLSTWLKDSLAYETSADELGELDQEQLERRVRQAADDRFYPEIRRMERQVLLNIVDGSWKDHLLAMDHLRSAISLKGYAQMDPKVEYKREGMRMYGDMWFSIGEKMTDLIFRMEALDEGFVASTWVETNAEHEKLPPSAMQAEQEENLRAADQAGAPEAKPEPIRNREAKVGRNDPCPCGSGKKYKACHGRK
jgi:preprotein translocase subunit SecA